MPRSDQDADHPMQYLTGNEARLQRVETFAMDAAVKVAQHGEQISSLTDRVTERFDATDEKLDEVLASLRPVADTLHHPEHGLVVRLTRLETTSKTRSARVKRWTGLALKVLVPLVVGVAATILGIKVGG